MRYKIKLEVKKFDLIKSVRKGVDILKQSNTGSK